MFHLVLFEPEIPPNTGNSIRLAANCGATLHLVKPLGFLMDNKHLQRSGLDYHDLAAVKVHENLEACIGELAGARWFAVETTGSKCYSEVDYHSGDVFLFGPETRGLSESLMSSVAGLQSLYIPMRPKVRSLNLSNTVAIMAYEVWRQLSFSGQTPRG